MLFKNFKSFLGDPASGLLLVHDPEPQPDLDLDAVAIPNTELLGPILRVLSCNIYNF